MINLVEFGEYLKALRKEKGFTAQELSDLSGVSRPYINNIEKGKRDKPSADILLKLAKPLGVDPVVILERAGYVSSHTKVESISGFSKEDLIIIRSLLKGNINFLIKKAEIIKDDFAEALEFLEEGGDKLQFTPFGDFDRKEFTRSAIMIHAEDIYKNMINTIRTIKTLRKTNLFFYPEMKGSDPEDKIILFGIEKVEEISEHFIEVIQRYLEYSKDSLGDERITTALNAFIEKLSSIRTEGVKFNG